MVSGTGFRVRRLQPELMDAPDLDPAVHRAALAGLRRINRWSRAAAPIWQAVFQIARQLPIARPLHVLDVGSGSGDLAVQLAERAQRVGLELRVWGCDLSPTAVAAAREYAEQRQCSAVEFQRANILSGGLPREQFDIVCCSLFLHHFTESQAIEVLRRMGQAATRYILVDDLLRSALGYGLAWVGCRLLTRSPIVHVDGPRSVEGAFSIEEVRRLAGEAGLREVQIRRHWPQRYLLSAAPAAGAIASGN